MHHNNAVTKERCDTPSSALCDTTLRHTAREWLLRVRYVAHEKLAPVRHNTNRSERRMPGTLFYVIGPSGAGKDSILRGARLALNPQIDQVWFAHRYITRPPDDSSENHVALSKDEFIARDQAGEFVLAWTSHGLRYGIGVEIMHWLKQVHVVVNGSRAYLPTALERIPTLQPILIDVDPDIRAARLRERARETPAEQTERLARGEAFADMTSECLIRIHNNGTLNDAIARFLRVLRATPS